MLSKILRVGAVAAALIAVPAHLSAQADPAAGGNAGAPAELQQITSKLTQIQQRAMQDPEIRAASEKLNASIQTAMRQLDPNFRALESRAETLKADVEAAKAAEDNAKLHELAAEAQELQAGIAAAREKAMADAHVQQQVEAYKVQLFEKMVEIDPEAQTLVTRMTEIQQGG